MKKSSVKTTVFLAIILIFILIFTACNNKELPEESSVVSTPPVDDVSDYILIGEIESSNEYLQTESNNIKVYGKSKDNLDNYTEIKFVYKDKEWIFDEVRIFADKEMEREDSRLFNLSLYEDRDIFSVTYYEKIASDEIKENMLFFDQYSFTLLNPEDLNVSIQHQSSEENMVIDETSYNLQTVIKSKIDPDIFDKKTVINKREGIEICALKKDSNNNYSDIYIKVYEPNKIIRILDRKHFEFGGLYFNVLDVNENGNDEIVLNFLEKTAVDELTQSVCFIDIKNEKEVTLSDLGLENIVEVTYGTDKYTIAQEGKEYKVNTCHYTRKVELNKDNFDTVSVKEIISMSEDNSITLSLLHDPVSYITENGGPDIFALQYTDKIGLYTDWTMPNYFDEINKYELGIDIKLIDVNDDGLNEIVISIFIGGGTGAIDTDLHIINSSSMEEMVTLTNRDVGQLLRSYVDSRVYIEDNKAKLDFYINDDMSNKYTYTFDYNENITYFDFLGYASLIAYDLDSDMNQVIVHVSAAIGINMSVGYYEAKLTWVDNNIVFSDIQFIINN
jgi:hypothetical protein